jgi:phytoene/squalene synthetase
MKRLFDEVSHKCSMITTKSYSTSFSLGILLFQPKIRPHIYAIYGFVRFADEIVDTFHDYNKNELFKAFKEETYKSIDQGISLNPILNSFQNTVRQFDMDRKLIDLFLSSMEMDLKNLSYDEQTYKDYILGSAEVVGLMCLTVFCQGDKDMYLKLKLSAMKLGSAFQKINFLRDLKADYEGLGRTYFPDVDVEQLDETTKRLIEEDIARDFQDGLEGIKALPRNSKFGVYLAYVYYHTLFQKIKKTHHQEILQKRIRVPNQTKYSLLVKSLVKYNLNIL